MLQLHKLQYIEFQEGWQRNPLYQHSNNHQVPPVQYALQAEELICDVQQDTLRLSSQLFQEFLLRIQLSGCPFCIVYDQF